MLCPESTASSMRPWDWHVFAGTSSGFGSAVHYSLVDPVEVAPAGDLHSAISSRSDSIR